VPWSAYRYGILGTLGTLDVYKGCRWHLGGFTKVPKVPKVPRFTREVAPWEWHLGGFRHH
jgi:hypothetical protein